MMAIDNPMNLLRLDPIVASGNTKELGNSLSAIRDYVTKAGQLAGLDKDAVYRMKLAVDEIAANIIMYGYGNDGLIGTVKASATIDDNRLTIILEDSAVAYDPRLLPKPRSLNDPLETREIGGLGVFLALNNVDEYDYERLENRNINRFSMKRKRTQLLITRGLCRVLLIEDSVQIRNEFLQSLNATEFTVTCVNDGTQALTTLQYETVDIIMMGVDLSSTDAADWVRHLKSSPGLHSTPVVIVSTDNATQPLMDCIAAGADDYILYPFDSSLVETRMKVSIHRTGTQYTKIKNILNMSEHIRRVLADTDISFHNSPDGAPNIDDFLYHALIEIKAMYNADAGTVYYRENKTLRFVVMQTDSIGINLGGITGDPVTLPPLDLYDPDTNEPNLRYMATYVALKGETINVPNIYASIQFDVTGVKAFDLNNNYHTISCLAVPLKNHKSEVIGVLQLLNARDEHGHIIPFDASRQMLTESLCIHVATILSNRLLLKQQVMMSKIEHDIRIGRQIQQAFLPSTFPEIRGWEISSYFHAAREIAGDFYDAFEMPNNRLGVLVADVCDKGVGAALFMSLMRSLLRAYAMQNYSINWASILDSQEILARKEKNVVARQLMPTAGMIALENTVKLTNNYVATIHGDLSMFATTFFGVLQPLTGSFLYINAGHCPPFIIDANGKIKQRIEATGPAVGMFADANFEIGEVFLEPEDTLFIYTDGVPDARNPARKLFTEERLVPMLEAPFSSVKELLTRIEVNLTNFIGDAVQFDDITMLAIRRGPQD
jgi:sigma-B regulation protein RsbU (phosphoserine phosphatase)